MLTMTGFKLSHRRTAGTGPGDKRENRVEVGTTGVAWVYGSRGGRRVDRGRAWIQWVIWNSN